MQWWYFGVVLLCSISYSQQFGLEELNSYAISSGFIKHLKDYILNVQTNISNNCTRDLSHYVDALTRRNISSLWALKMFDAGTKIPSGILTGKIIDFGAFDECLSVHDQVSQISGKYCLGTIPPGVLIKIIGQSKPKVITPDKQPGGAFATCLPDACTTEDITIIYSFLNIEFFDSLCQTKASQPKFEGGDIALLSFLSVMLSVVISSTIYDYFLFRSSGKPAHPLLLAFSALTNSRKLFKVTESPDQISCLHGIRVITMMWIILGHRHALYLEAMDNFVDFVNWVDDGVHMYVMGSTVSVDTFLLLSGLVLSYIFISQTAKGTKVNIFVFYLHRYIRLTPVIAIIMVIYATVFIHLGNGPLWIFKIGLFQGYCQKYWWSTLLYVQNYVNTREVCISQTWYVSADTQLFIISPLILFPMKKYPRIAIMIASLLGFASIVTSFIIAYQNNLSGLMIKNFANMEDFKYKYYFLTHTRATPWFIGIIVGYYIYKIKISKNKILLNKVSVLALWILALGLLYTCAFVGHNTFWKPNDRVANAFFIALGRTGWTLGVAMVILLCTLGYGGPVNWFLSISIFQILSKLTYTMFLIHMGMQFILFYQERSAPHFKELPLLHEYWGDYMFTLGTSLIFTLGFESPIVSIEKFIFGGSKKPKRKTIVEEEKPSEIP